jgi:hypothetical protein
MHEVFSMMRSSDCNEDTSQPIIVAANDLRAPKVHDANDSFNRFVLSERENAGKRIRIRVAFECYSRIKGGGLQFTRLRGRHVLLSLPDSGQAEIAVELIRQVCSQMHGKHLAKK